MQILPILEEGENTAKGGEKVIMCHKIFSLLYPQLLRSCRKMDFSFQFVFHL